MKSLSLNQIKQVGVLITLALITAMTTGCPDKGKSKSERGYRYRSNNYRNPMIDSRTGEQINDWGVIYKSTSGSFDSSLQYFMEGANDLGYVSGRIDDSTGIRFRGIAREGSDIEIMIWDEYADQEGPYFWKMRVVEVGNTYIVAEDDLGEVEFTGRDSGSEWVGTVSFQNFGDTRRSLGNFRIPLNILF